MALATRLGTKIFVEDSLLDAEGVILQTEDAEVGDDANPDELVSEFRDFIEGIRPEDFGS
jgi:bifunctional DNase/RNase